MVRSHSIATLRALLEWQVDAGHDAWLTERGLGWGTVEAEARIRTLLSTSAKPSAKSDSAPDSAPATPVARSPSLAAREGEERLVTPSVDRGSALQEAQTQAAGCSDLVALERAVSNFDLCPLKAGAISTVFAEGNPASGLMIVGEAPGREEDQQGKPFVGASGQLLAQILSYIGIRDRSGYYITNLVYWRPPGNRAPNLAELALCRPFFERQVALVRPRWLLLLGNIAAQSVLREKVGITRIRGQWRSYESSAGFSVAVLASFHPSYLLRTPLQKRMAWRDALALQSRMERDRGEKALDSRRHEA